MVDGVSELGLKTFRRSPGARRLLADDRALRGLLEESLGELVAEARRRPVGEVVTRRTRDGRRFEMARGAVVAQVATHGTHHRAQCLNMLRQLGVRPLPASSVAEWAWVGAGVTRFRKSWREGSTG